MANVQSMDIDDSDTEEDEKNEARSMTLESNTLDKLCFRQFSAMLDHNMTAGAVTASLRAWSTSVGHLLPLELAASLPTTCKQLIGH